MGHVLFIHLLIDIQIISIFGAVVNSTSVDIHGEVFVRVPVCCYFGRVTVAFCLNALV